MTYPVRYAASRLSQQIRSSQLTAALIHGNVGRPYCRYSRSDSRDAFMQQRRCLRTPTSRVLPFPLCSSVFLYYHPKNERHVKKSRPTTSLAFRVLSQSRSHHEKTRPEVFHLRAQPQPQRRAARTSSVRKYRRTCVHLSPPVYAPSRYHRAFNSALPPSSWYASLS